MYKAPLDDIAFTLKQVAGLKPAIDAGLLGDLGEDLVDAILSEAGRFAGEEVAPLYKVGDEVGAVLKDAEVTMPPGWRDLYRRWVEGGWNGLSGPEEFGGQGLPTSVAMAQAPASAAQRTTGLPRTVSGRNGSLARISRQPNSTHSTTDPTSRPIIGSEIQSKRRPPQESASSMATAALIIRPAPSKSSVCLRGRKGTRLSTLAVMPSAAKPIGRLIQKISDQSRCSVRSRPAPGRPPTTGRTPRRYSPGSGRARAV